jgi:amino acid permease
MTVADILVPEYDSPSRKSTIVVAGFNLVASIMGGGVLSIPFAYSKTGIVLGSLLMCVAAITTERAMYLLCLCSRITGAKTFGEVGEAAFGKNMEYFISCILCIFLCFAIIGYMVLAKDIWTSVIMVIGNMETSPNDEFVLGSIIILIFPLLVQKSLHALRFSCYVGVFSVSTLCLALVRHAWAAPVWSDIVWWSTNLEDVLVAFPIISLSFLGIFNVLPIQNALLKPSRPRITLVLDGAITTVFTISIIFGLAGYLYAGVETDGNILKNCETAGDFNLLLGKLGCGTMVVLAIPMMMLPCRSCLLEVMDVLVNGAHVTSVEVEESEKLPLVTSNVGTNERNYHATSTATNEEDSQQSQEVEEETVYTCPKRRRKVNVLDNIFIHYASTFFIFATCYMVAIRVPGIAIVWSILGCSLGYLVAYILPCVCYLKIQKRYPAHALKNNSWVWFARILLVTSIVATVVCTAETLKGIL